MPLLQHALVLAAAWNLAAATSATAAVVLRACSFSGGGPFVAPQQRFAFDTSLSSFALQDGSGRCLSLSACSGDNGEVVALVPCAPNGSICQAWNMTDDRESPPNAIKTALTGRCLAVNSAHNPDAIVVWDCADPPSQWRNEEWAFNASSGALTSLDSDPTCGGLCLTPAPVSVQDFKIGMYDYFVDESSPVLFNGVLLMFESIVKASPQWAGNWLPAFAGCDCYFRVRDMRTLSVIVNLTASCNHAFGAAVVYIDASSGSETLLVSGTPWSRAYAERDATGWSGPCQSTSNCSVDLFWTADPALHDGSWSAAMPGIHVPGIGVYNNDITSIPPNAGLPFHWVMALETTQETARFAVSAATNPTNTSAWMLLGAEYTVPSLPDVGPCPSLRHDGVFFYYLTGGSNIQILRSTDLRSWNMSSRHVLAHTDPGDCVIAPAWFGAPTGYVPSPAAEALLTSCGAGGNFGDDSDVDLIEWPAPFGSSSSGPAVLLQYGSSNQATFGFANLGLWNGTLNAFLQSYFD